METQMHKGPSIMQKLWTGVERLFSSTKSASRGFDDETEARKKTAEYVSKHIDRISAVTRHPSGSKRTSP